MNYKELIKEINIAVAGLSEEDAMSLNMLDWIKDNIMNGTRCVECDRVMPDNESGYCYQCNEK